MTTLTGEQVGEKVKKVMDYDIEECENFARLVSCSDIDNLSRQFLYRAIDMRLNELNSRPLIVDGEIKAEELI